jgi:hypothetical protein
MRYTNWAQTFGWNFNPYVHEPLQKIMHFQCFSRADFRYWLSTAETSYTVQSDYRRRSWLQYHTGNKEIEVELWGCLGRCIPTSVKFHLSSSRKIHSKSQWMSMANPFAVLKRLFPGLSQLRENAEHVKYCHFRVLPGWGKNSPAASFSPGLGARAKKQLLYINLDHFGI